MTNEQLKTLRLYHRLTVREMSQLTGISIATISGIERGTRNISALTRAKVARVFPQLDSEFISFSRKVDRLSHYKNDSTK